MADSMRGLRIRPSHEQLIGVAVSDGLQNIKFPNRDATFLRNGFILSQLDGGYEVDGEATRTSSERIA